MDFPNKSTQHISTDFRLTKSHMNILLLGESGAGKSTFINCLPNYLKYPIIKSLNQNIDKAYVAIPAMVTIYDDNYQEIETKYCHGISAKDVDNECFIQGQSATQNVNAHKFQINNCELTIIDTPGLGDSRGVEQDKKNFQMTMDFLKNYKELDAIFILVHPNYLHLNAGLRTVLHLVVERFGKVAMNNIFFCFTRTSDVSYGFGDTLSGLRIFFKLRNYGIELGRNNCFSFENEGFSCLLKHKINYKNDPFCEKSWNHSVNELKRLLKECSSVLPFNVEDPRIIHEILPELLRIHDNLRGNNVYYTEQDLPIEDFNLILETFEKACNLPDVLQNFKKQSVSNDQTTDLKRAIQFMEKFMENARKSRFLQNELSYVNKKYHKLQMETQHLRRNLADESKILCREVDDKDNTIRELKSKLGSKQYEITQLQRKHAEEIRKLKEAFEKKEKKLRTETTYATYKTNDKDKIIRELITDLSSKQNEINQLKHEKEGFVQKEKRNIQDQMQQKCSTLSPVIGKDPILERKFFSEYELNSVYIGDPQYADKEQMNCNGYSSTQTTNSYKIWSKDQFFIVVDTPGIGDSRGSTHDDKTINDILQHIQQYKSISAVCVLMDSNGSSKCLEPFIKTISSSFPSNFQSKFLYCFTKTRRNSYGPGDSFGSLQKLVKQQLNKDDVFCFDNESFSHSVKMSSDLVDNDIKRSLEEFETCCRESFVHSRKETLRLLNRIGNMDHA